MAENYVWDERFRERLIALCLDASWFARFGIGIILPEYFETDAEEDVVAAIIEFYHRYRRPPARDELCAFAEWEDPEIGLIDEAFYVLRNEDLDFAADKALTFAKQQAMKLAILDSVDDIKSDKLDQPLLRVREAMTVGTDRSDAGLDLVGDVKDWVYRLYSSVKVPTGIHHVDAMLGGGLGRGELGIWLGGSNVGKTRALVNTGFGAATFLTGSNVAHIVVESTADLTAKRYGARASFRWITGEDDPDMYAAEFIEAARLRLGGKIWVKQYPTGGVTVDDLEAYLDMMDGMGHVIDVLIVDYPDIMKHTYKGDKWQAIGDTYEQLKGLALRRDIAVWGASQARREALGKEIVTIGDIAESYEKVKISDVILALCQTGMEYENDIMRIFAAKIRDGDKFWFVECHTDRDSHAIISEDIVTLSDLIKRREDREAG